MLAWYSRSSVEEGLDEVVEMLSVLLVSGRVSTVGLGLFGATAGGASLALSVDESMVMAIASTGGASLALSELVEVLGSEWASVSGSTSTSVSTCSACATAVAQAASTDLWISGSEGSSGRVLLVGRARQVRLETRPTDLVTCEWGTSAT